MKKILLIWSIVVLISCMQLDEKEVLSEKKESSSSLSSSSSSIGSSSQSSSSRSSSSLKSSSSLALKTKMGETRLYTGINYYEAIRICNEKSLEEDLDTLYQHDKHSFVGGGPDFWLPNIKVLEGRSGYRLPTKEEWIKAQGEIKDFNEDISEWIYIESNSEIATFELAPSFSTRVSGLSKGPNYGMRVVKVH